jgi:iron complex outermembrane receptor protein
VDVFNLKEASLVLPQTNINQILNAVAPSFTSTVQTNADGTDHLDPGS